MYVEVSFLFLRTHFSKSITITTKIEYVISKTKSSHNNKTFYETTTLIESYFNKSESSAAYRFGWCHFCRAAPWGFIIKIHIILRIALRDYYSFKIFHRIWLAQSPRLILHDQLALTKFGRGELYTMDLMVYWLGNEVDRWYIDLKTRIMGNRPSINLVSRRCSPAVYSRVN